MNKTIFIILTLFCSKIYSQNNLTVKELRASQIRGLYTGFKQDGNVNDSTVNFLLTDYDTGISPKSLITVNDTSLREWVSDQITVITYGDYNPTITLSVGGSTGITVTSSGAEYSIIDKQIFIQGFVSFSWNGTGGGGAIRLSLPSGITCRTGFIVNGGFTNWNQIFTGVPVNVRTQSASNFVDFQEYNTGGASQVMASDIGSTITNLDITFNMSFRIN